MFAVLCLITFLFFRSGPKLVTFLGENLIGVISRLMGLILASIGTHMVILGVKGAASSAH